MGQTLRVPSAGPGSGQSCPDAVVTYHGLAVPVGPHLAADHLRALQDGSFAASLLRAAVSAVLPADRVLFLGAAEGVVVAAIARNCRPTELLAFEPDAALLTQAGTLCRHNGLADRVTLRHGQVLANPDAPHDPDLAGAPGFDAMPVVRYDRVRQERLHNVLVIASRGAELAFLRHAPLSGVRLVVVGLSPEVYGRPGVRACRRALHRAGYERDLALSVSEARAGPAGAVDVFRRVRA